MPVQLPKPIFRLVRSLRSFLFCRSLRRKVRNRDFSIICNTCIGGLLYNQLGMQFLSPTINIAFTPDEFIDFCKDLRYYLSCPLVDVSAEMERPYPVGRLTPQDREHRPVTLLFVHYDTFEQAAERWAARAERVRMDNLVFIMICGTGKEPSPERFLEFESLPGLKLSILQLPVQGVRHACILPFCDEQGQEHLFDKDGVTGRRVYNRYDFAAFLNGEISDVVDLRPVSPPGGHCKK